MLLPLVLDHHLVHLHFKKVKETDVDKILHEIDYYEDKVASEHDCLHSGSHLKRSRVTSPSDVNQNLGNTHRCPY